MKDHINYSKVVAKHRFYVFLACLKLKVSFWQALVHDMSKLSKREWVPYVHNFFNKDGTKREVRDKSGAYDPNSQSLEFKYAWLSHQKNWHHWQAWVSIGDYGKMDILPMPERYVREMIADWIGAGKTYGNNDPGGWYEKNKDKMLLHVDSIELIEKLLGEFGY